MLGGGTVSNLPALTMPTAPGATSRASALLLAFLMEQRANRGESVKLHPTAARIVARLITEAVAEGA